MKSEGKLLPPNWRDGQETDKVIADREQKRRGSSLQLGPAAWDTANWTSLRAQNSRGPASCSEGEVPHFGEFYLQDPNWFSKRRLEKNRPCASSRRRGKVTILKYFQISLFSLTRPALEGNHFVRS